MANVQSVIDIIFNGIDNASNVIADLGGALGDFDTQVQDIAAPFADFADQLIAVETAALATGIALTGMAINAADKFDIAFREIATLTDESVESLEGFRAELLAYAATSTQSLETITQATYNAISQGVAYTDSLNAVAVAEKLAVAGKADINTTIQGLIGTLNAYGKGMDSAAEFSDIFFTTVKLGKTTIPELAASISGVTSTAQLGGVSFEQLGAAIATLTSAGAGTSEAITRLNALISAIATPSAQAVKLAEELGIGFDAAALKSKGLAGVLEEVRDKTGGAADKMGVLFGSTEALNAVNVLAITNSEKFKSNLEAMANAAGATDTAFAKMQDATDTLAQAFEVALVSFGTPLLDQFNAAEDALASLAGAFIKVAAGGGLEPLQALINDALGSISENIDVIAKNLPEAFKGLDWTGALESLKGLQNEISEIFKTFFGDIDLTTVEGLQSALQTVIKTFEVLTITVTGIISQFKPLADFLGELIRKFNDTDKASQLDFGKFLGAMKLVVDVGTGLGLVLLGIGQAGIAMAGVMDIAFGGVKTAINVLQVAFDTFALTITGVLGVITKATYETLEALGSDEDADRLKQLFKALGDTTTAIEQNLLRNAQEMADATRQVAKGWDAVTGSGGEAGQALGELRAELIANRDAAKETGKSLLDTLKDYQSFASGIDDALDSVDDTLRNLKTEFQPGDFDIGNPFEEAVAGVDAFQKAADNLDFGADQFNLQESLIKPLIDSKKAFDDLDKKISQAEWGDGDGLSVEEPMDKNIKATQVWNEELGRMVTVYDSSTKATVKATGAFAAVADKTKDAKDQLDALTKGGKLTVEQLLEVTKTANDFEVKMEEIASNERIKTIEASVSLNIAGLEADVKRVQSAFASIDNTVNSTGDLLGSLFGNLTGTTDRYKESAIQSQIDLENKRRQEALDMQKKLVEAEIARIEAQTRQLQRGDPWIKIDGTGLAPQLEAFMWEILKAIRTQVNAEFADFLLGVGVTP